MAIKRQWQSMKMKIIITIYLVIFTAAPSAIAGTLGHLRRNLELEQAMREGSPPAGYRYYATGRTGVPDAVLGLDPAYRQTARFWREIDPESEDLSKLVRSVMIYHEFERRAYEVLTPDGNVIGVYWSNLFWTSIVMGDKNEIKIYRPLLPEEDAAR